MAQMSFRIDDMSKLQFEKLCEDLGINPTIAFTMFIKKMIREQRIPFDVSIYSRETLLALEETRLKKNLSAEFNDVDSLFSSLDSED